MHCEDQETPCDPVKSVVVPGTLIPCSYFMKGQLKVSMYMNFGLLTVHVIQGRQLSYKMKSMCDSFVKLSLIPDDGKKSRCKTEVIHDSNNPLYDEKFSFELTEEDRNKRLLISTWHYDQSSSSNQFLGCMSFGVRHLTNPKKDSSGWYYLLTEDIGRRKHLQVSSRQKPQLKLRSHSNIPSINKDVWGMESLQINLTRGKHGFGFSVVEGCPVKVGRVDGASPAEQAGLHKEDIIIRVNGQNVSRSTAISVAKLVKHSSNNLCIEVQRSQQMAYEQLDYPTWQSTTTCPSFPGNQVTSDPPKPQEENIYHTIYEEPWVNYCDARKENEISVDDEDALFNPNMATSTPLPLLCNGHKTVVTSERQKQEAVHRLLSLELDFIDLMHSGMQRYSRPLRHCILKHTYHSALFQNIEKLTTISEYHVKQMHDNVPSMTSDDTDTSGESHHFVNSIGLIYQSKVHMLCQAYELYAKGISEANKVLSDLRKSEDFIKFISNPPLKGRQPSISTFIFRPVQHIRELYQVLREIFLSTAAESTDYSCLKQVVEGLQECVNNITNFSCERVESLTSLTSKDSRGSFTGSMKSHSSSASSSSGGSSASKHTTGSLQNIRTVDTEVMKIQDRLVFAPHVPIMQLCQEGRHVIFSGDMFMWEVQQWVKLQVFLFTDIVLLTRKEPDGFLHVLEPPTNLKDVLGIDAQRKHGTEFVLHCSGKGSSSRKVHFRAPSTEQKYAWKSLLEQRVYSLRGSLEYFSSSSDLSSTSSAIVI